VSIQIPRWPPAQDKVVGDVLKLSINWKVKNNVRTVWFTWYYNITSIDL